MIDELLQCFDEEGHPITPLPRSVVHQEPLKYWHGIADIWVVDRNGLLLCSRRSFKLPSAPGKWQSCFGGHMKAGATFLETAIAELHEESGLRATEDTLFLVEKGKGREEHKHFFAKYLYIFDEARDAVSFNDGETIDSQWMDMATAWVNRQNYPESWCNGCKPEWQEKIREILKEKI